ncbi:unnamed protein product [Vitrella brassicaformis CCMP3155]|uniref:Uncharacterized protein n=2 Tax=Vitrella brassicaformis TaxID=1169539 RepID=A0A0G4EP68_VITBC|nr:unnamed protein product [Vitrella brassicaformis CCMP3155]|eukprot:CEL99607.1 unnamed protein product [Vitrella brassicaformis CCMP3155]
MAQLHETETSRRKGGTPLAAADSAEDNARKGGSASSSFRGFLDWDSRRLAPSGNNTSAFSPASFLGELKRLFIRDPSAPLPPISMPPHLAFVQMSSNATHSPGQRVRSTVRNGPSMSLPDMTLASGGLDAQQVTMLADKERPIMMTNASVLPAGPFDTAKNGSRDMQAASLGDLLERVRAPSAPKKPFHVSVAQNSTEGDLASEADHLMAVSQTAANNKAKAKTFRLAPEETPEVDTFTGDLDAGPVSTGRGSFIQRFQTDRQATRRGTRDINGGDDPSWGEEVPTGDRGDGGDMIQDDSPATPMSDPSRSLYDIRPPMAPVASPPIGFTSMSAAAYSGRPAAPLGPEDAGDMRMLLKNTAAQYQMKASLYRPPSPLQTAVGPMYSDEPEGYANNEAAYGPIAPLQMRRPAALPMFRYGGSSGYGEGVPDMQGFDGFIEMRAEKRRQRRRRRTRAHR